jgi:agmatine deiminase
MSESLATTPQADGFRMPGEFEAHAGCWMLWPERTDNWRLGARPAQQAFAAVAAAIARFEPVTVGASARQYLHARDRLPAAVRLIELSANDCWMRDVGPTFVVNDAGIVRGVDWEFNAWGGLTGGLYFPWDQDNLVARKVLDLEGLDRYRAGFVLEGGSIHTDGQGTLLTTEECLLNPNRNPGLSRAQIEARLKDYLGVERVVWLPRGVVDDETSGHIDNLCCFLRPGVVVLTWTDDASDPQHEVSSQALAVLEAERDARGRRLQIHKLHQPGPIRIAAEEAEGVDRIEGTLPRRAGDRLAASYVNFYLPDGGLILPVFGDPRDGEAVSLLERLCPERRLVPLPAREILLGGGNIHCITQQQPRGLPREARTPSEAAGR